MNNNILFIGLVCLISSVIVTIVILIVEKITSLFCPKCYKNNIYVLECKEVESDSLDIKKIKKLKKTFTYKCASCGHVWTQKRR